VESLSGLLKKSSQVPWQSIHTKQSEISAPDFRLNSLQWNYGSVAGLTLTSKSSFKVTRLYQTRCTHLVTPLISTITRECSGADTRRQRGDTRREPPHGEARICWARNYGSADGASTPPCRPRNGSLVAHRKQSPAARQRRCGGLRLPGRGRQPQ